MKQKQCICQELKEEVRGAVFGESCEIGTIGSPHRGSRWDNHPSLYSSASWLADTSLLTLQITSVPTVQLRLGLQHCLRGEFRLENAKVTLDP